jgi:homoserine kinase
VPAAPGIALTVKKGLPLSGGQGGSAASAIAGAAAANALLGGILDTNALLECGLIAEAKVAGRHLDNIAPALLGGITLIRSIDPIDVVRLPVPTGLRLVLAHPAQRLSTAMARRALPRTVPLPTVTHQLAQVAAMVAACYLNDLALFGRAIQDRIAEPARASLIPGFIDAKRAAMDAGALGASISGAGPTAFAIADDLQRAHQIAAAMNASYARQGIECTTTVTEIDMDGTIVRPL